MPNRFKSYLKKNKFLCSCYYDVAMLMYYLLAKKNYWINKKNLTKKDIDRIKSYKGIHRGERCFIIGTGPSQNVNDLEMLRNEYCIGINADYRVYSKTTWRPQYYVVMDEHVFSIFPELIDDKEEYQGFFQNSFLQKKRKDSICLRVDGANLFFLKTKLNKYFPVLFPVARFSSDISKKVYCGKTVVYTAIQIAAYMGFSEIYLSGVDCNYGADQKHSTDMGYSKREVIDWRDTIEMGAMMIQQFNALASILPKYHVSVFNATRGGMLEAFPRVQLENLGLSESQE